MSHLGFPDACGTVSLLFGPPLIAAALSCRVCLRKHEAQALATPMEGGCLCLAVLPGARASPTTGSSTEGAPCAGHCPESTAEIPLIPRTRACSWHWMCSGSHSGLADLGWAGDTLQRTRDGTGWALRQQTAWPDCHLGGLQIGQEQGVTGRTGLME